MQGAVQYGLDPSIVHVRRAKCTYGIGVIRPFVQVNTGLYGLILEIIRKIWKRVEQKVGK